ncbi:hypothetical protein B0H13DRAFT_2277893 [Mycena leptocephala]|nr:hypothetical protein B0H13DRAFT_2277893 [Mycena leptocephala]
MPNLVPVKPVAWAQQVPLGCPYDRCPLICPLWQFSQTRLDLSEIAVVAGLVVSITLALLSLPPTIFHQQGEDDQHILIDGIGILHAIWLYRDRPTLEALLEQVEHLTDKNLREAGLVRGNHRAAQAVLAPEQSTQHTIQGDRQMVSTSHSWTGVAGAMTAAPGIM